MILLRLRIDVQRYGVFPAFLMIIVAPAHLDDHRQTVAVPEWIEVGYLEAHPPEQGFYSRIHVLPIFSICKEILPDDGSGFLRLVICPQDGRFMCFVPTLVSVSTVY